MKPLFTFLFLLSLTLSTFANPLKPLKLESPRDTMKTYWEAMSDYRKGLETGDPNLKNRIQDAIRCLNLSESSAVIRQEVGKKAALMLKETIDRVIVLDFSKIPDDPQVKRWRLKDTEIVISYVESGDHVGEYLFSPETVARSEEFYNKVKDLPYLKGGGQGVFLKTPFWQKHLPEWAKEKTLNIFNWQWLGILLSILLGLIIKLITEFLVLAIKKWTNGRQESLRHKTLLAIEKPIGLIVATGFWYIAIYALRMEGTALAILLTLTKITFSISLIWAAYNITDVISQYLSRITEKTESTLDDQLVPLVTKALRVFVVIFGILLSIQNLGFNVMSLMAGLGLGGLAFALAAKDTAANLFGSVMILIDRPFRIGDWIKSSGIEGMVEEIGFRSTRVRTFYNSLLSVPNSVLANAHIDNMGLREFRRVSTTLGLTYDTPPDKMDRFINGVKNIIERNEFTRKDGYYVVFTEYGSSSLNIMLYFFLKVPDWAGELKEKQNINMAILELAKEVGVEFAFPTQTLHIESLPPQKSLN